MQEYLFLVLFIILSSAAADMDELDSNFSKLKIFTEDNLSLAPSSTESLFVEGKVLKIVSFLFYQRDASILHPRTRRLFSHIPKYTKQIDIF